MSTFKFNINGTITVKAPDEGLARMFLGGGFTPAGTIIEDFDGDIEVIPTEVYWFTYNIAIRAESPFEAEEILNEYIKAQPETVYENAQSVVVESPDPRADFPISREDI